MKNEQIMTITNIELCKLILPINWIMKIMNYEDEDENEYFKIRELFVI